MCPFGMPAVHAASLQPLCGVQQRSRTAKASGRRASRVWPSWYLSCSSFVFPRNASSDSACMLGSSALMASTFDWYSLRVFSAALPARCKQGLSVEVLLEGLSYSPGHILLSSVPNNDWACHMKE